MLTYWRGTSRQGIGTGEMVMLDQSYRVIRRIRTANGFRPDLHEFRITPDDKALIITYPIVRQNLKPVKGPKRGLVVDSVIQEIDLETGLVTFEWHSLGHIGIKESFAQPRPGTPFDYAHTNSVNPDGGDFLMSARNTWTAYRIDRETGKIQWRLGGKKSTFKLPPAARFAWQHDAHRRADGAITVFDNSAFPPVRKFSRALAIRLNEGARTASLISAASHPRKVLTATQGNQQTLPNGNFMVGWGSQRQLTEYGPAGNVLFNAALSLGYESYRSYRLPWVGLPRSRPVVAAADEPGAGTDAYMSWNGATEVATWELFAGSSREHAALGRPESGGAASRRRSRRRACRASCRCGRATPRATCSRRRRRRASRADQHALNLEPVVEHHDAARRGAGEPRRHGDRRVEHLLQRDAERVGVAHRLGHRERAAGEPAVLALAASAQRRAGAVGDERDPAAGTLERVADLLVGHVLAVDDQLDRDAGIGERRGRELGRHRVVEVRDGRDVNGALCAALWPAEIRMPRRVSSSISASAPGSSGASVTCVTGPASSSRRSSARSGARRCSGGCAPLRSGERNGPSRCTPRQAPARRRAARGSAPPRAR